MFQFMLLNLGGCRVICRGVSALSQFKSGRSIWDAFSCTNLFLALCCRSAVRVKSEVDRPTCGNASVKRIFLTHAFADFEISDL